MSGLRERLLDGVCLAPHCGHPDCDVRREAAAALAGPTLREEVTARLAYLLFRQQYAGSDAGARWDWERDSGGLGYCFRARAKEVLAVPEIALALDLHEAGLAPSASSPEADAEGYDCFEAAMLRNLQVSESYKPGLRDFLVRRLHGLAERIRLAGHRQTLRASGADAPEIDNPTVRISERRHIALERIAGLAEAGRLNLDGMADAARKEASLDLQTLVDTAEERYPDLARPPTVESLVPAGRCS